MRDKAMGVVYRYKTTQTKSSKLVKKKEKNLRRKGKIEKGRDSGR